VQRAPELDAGLQVRSHWSGAEGQNPLPGPAGHSTFNEVQDMFGLIIYMIYIVYNSYNITLHIVDIMSFILWIRLD